MKVSARQTGFTLIELLVVIAIIGTLASVVLASLNSAREKARNASMLSTIDQFKKAVELYYLANNNYPSHGGGSWTCVGDYDDNKCWSNSHGDYSETASFNNAMEPYMNVASIKNPTNNNNPEGIMYGSRNSGKGYELIFVLDSDNQDCGSANRRREASSAPYNRSNGSTACAVCVNHSSVWCEEAY